MVQESMFAPPGRGTAHDDVVSDAWAGQREKVYTLMPVAFTLTPRKNDSKERSSSRRRSTKDSADSVSQEIPSSSSTTKNLRRDQSTTTVASNVSDESSSSSDNSSSSDTPSRKSSNTQVSSGQAQEVNVPLEAPLHQDPDEHPDSAQNPANRLCYAAYQGDVGAVKYILSRRGKEILHMRCDYKSGKVAREEREQKARASEQRQWEEEQRKIEEERQELLRKSAENLDESLRDDTNVALQKILSRSSIGSTGLAQQYADGKMNATEFAEKRASQIEKQVLRQMQKKEDEMRKLGWEMQRERLEMQERHQRMSIEASENLVDAKDARNAIRQKHLARESYNNYKNAQSNKRGSVGAGSRGSIVSGMTTPSPAFAALEDPDLMFGAQDLVDLGQQDFAELIPAKYRGESVFNIVVRMYCNGGRVRKMLAKRVYSMNVLFELIHMTVKDVFVIPRYAGT